MRGSVFFVSTGRFSVYLYFAKNFTNRSDFGILYLRKKFFINLLFIGISSIPSGFSTCFPGRNFFKQKSRPGSLEIFGPGPNRSDLNILIHCRLVVNGNFFIHAFRWFETPAWNRRLSFPPLVFPGRSHSPRYQANGCSPILRTTFGYR